MVNVQAIHLKEEVEEMLHSGVRNLGNSHVLVTLDMMYLFPDLLFVVHRRHKVEVLVVPLSNTMGVEADFDSGQNVVQDDHEGHDGREEEEDQVEDLYQIYHEEEVVDDDLLFRMEDEEYSIHHFLTILFSKFHNDFSIPSYIFLYHFHNLYQVLFALKLHY